MRTLTIDFETYYDKEYSLSRLTTEEYIKDKRFEIIGVAVKENNQRTEWFSNTHAAIQRWLQQFDWAHSGGIAHNAPFDMAILNWVLGIRPAKIMDTLAMARPLHINDGQSLGLAKLAERYNLGQKGTEVIAALGKRRKDFTDLELARYGSYCCNDVELTYKLARELAPRLPPEELDLIDITQRMFTEPVLELDQPLLEAHLHTVRHTKQKLMDNLPFERKTIMSNQKFAQVLEALGVDVPMKTSPATGKPTFAFAKSDEEFTQLQDHEDPRVQALVNTRLGVKSTIEETRTERFIGISKRNGVLPIPLKYYGAHTGRWAGEAKINLQNLKRKSPIKTAMRAPDGYCVLDADSSQIEARTLAWVAGEDTLVDLFRQNDAEVEAGVPKEDMEFDPYRIMASQVYGHAVQDITQGQRHVGKVTVLSAQYGVGWRTLLKAGRAQGADLDERLARRVVDVYRGTFTKIPAIWATGDRAISDMISGTEAKALDMHGLLQVGERRLDMPNGLALCYPNLRWDDKHQSFVYDAKRGRSTLKKFLWGGSLAENYTQALARIIIGLQMVEIAKRYKIALTVHDSVVSVIPQDEMDEASLFITRHMRTGPDWAAGLPLNCELKSGDTYG